METPLPKIPTDNLYKFAAITGALLFIIGISISLIIHIALNAELQNRRYENKINELLRESTALKVQFWDSYDSSVYLTNMIELLLKLKNHSIDSDAYKIAEMKGISDLGKRRIMRLDSFLNHFQYLSPKPNKIEYYTRPNIAFFLIISLLFVLGGFYLSSWGFKNWYNRLQKPLDSWYKKQVEEQSLPNRDNEKEMD